MYVVIAKKAADKATLVGPGWPIESNVKCRFLKRLTCKGSLRHVFIYLRPPALPS
jgi:hypothetical protein